MIRKALFGILGIAAAVLLTAPRPIFAQAAAANATIEGVIRDATGAVLPGVTVTVTNTGTGATRVVVSNESGLYRAQLLPLGTYRIEAELPGFRKYAQEGIELTAGRTATVNIRLEVGEVAETVTVTADSPVVEPAKIELGRVLNEREISNIPLVSRNPYNFALLQANVTGYENEEFGVPRINANGTQMRTNYQIDGNANMQVDRAGLRITPASEIFVQEVNLVTSGFAPEFGQTTGMVYNIVSPSGTNDLKGSASYRFRRKDFSSRPFFLSESRPKPDTHVDNLAATVGGPVKTDKWHYYFGYENVARDLSADRVITVDPSAASRLGISSALGDGVIPADANAHFFIGKTDYQIDQRNQLSVRYNLFDQVISDNIGGGLNTLERSIDFDDRADNVAAQLITTLGADVLNELRFNWIKRVTRRTPSEFSGPGPAVAVSGVANFGGPTTLNVFTEEVFQVVDSFSLYRGNHAYKFGANLQFVSDFRQEPVFTEYTFATAEDYLAAVSGADPFAYTRFQQTVGDPTLDIDSAFYGFFFQDDWSVTPNFKLLYGVRYDLFDVPEPRPFAENPASSDFRVDKNNWAPRVGFSWDLSGEAKTVLSAHSGIMYDPPLIRFYEDAILSNGDPRFQTFTLNPGSPEAPAFPNSIADRPGDFSRPSTIRTVTPDFTNYYTLQTTVQLRHALRPDLSFEVAYVNAEGNDLPVVLDVNLINPVGQLADGRPVYSTAVNAETRANPSFNHVLQVESIGDSSYNALTFRVNKRFAQGLQFNSFYTLAKAEDNAPLGGRYVVASGDTQNSDPTNIDFDRGATPFDVRHTWITSGVWRLPTDTQIGFVLNFNSGLPFTIRSNQDANKDGVSNNDRPVGAERNAGNLGWYKQVDARFSQFVPLSGPMRIEVFGEFTNLFNTENLRGVNSTVRIDDAANALDPTDDDFFRNNRATQGYLARQFQLGVKFHF